MFSTIIYWNLQALWNLYFNKNINDKENYLIITKFGEIIYNSGILIYQKRITLWLGE